MWAYDILSEYSLALMHIKGWRVQCSALRAAPQVSGAEMDPAVTEAFGVIADALEKAGENLAAVALERGSTIGDY